MNLVISSLGVNPSNRGSGFTNLARHTPAPPDVVKDVSDQCEAELIAAGIKVFRAEWLLKDKSEVPSEVKGHIRGWDFERAWYYWRASGPGIHPEIAEKLHATHGTQVRVDGHCGCPSPLEYFHGFGVGSYHVDSPEGLKALADVIRSIYVANGADPDSDRGS